MNATIRSEKVESPEVDSNLAAVSEVEAGIRDFVRNDVAYLRRPPTLTPETTALEPSTEATVNNVNSLIQRVAGTSLAEIENLIGELEACATCCMPKASASSAKSPAMPSSARPR
jgi:hypothetical protein